MNLRRRPTPGHPRRPSPRCRTATWRHSLEVGYGAPLRVSWDVRDVPGADGAMLEISAAGPTATGNQNPFNNPNGTVRDANGTDTGSVYFAPLHGSHATVTLSPGQVGLLPTTYVVRVLPTRNCWVVGEASEVSTVSRDGVRPTGGEPCSAASASTPTAATASTANLTGGSVQVFDQSTNAVTRTVASGAGRYQTPGLNRRRCRTAPAASASISGRTHPDGA